MDYPPPREDGEKNVIGKDIKQDKKMDVKGIRVKYCSIGMRLGSSEY